MVVTITCLDLTNNFSRMGGRGSRLKVTEECKSNCSTPDVSPRIRCKKPQTPEFELKLNQPRSSVAARRIMSESETLRLRKKRQLSADNLERWALNFNDLIDDPIGVELFRLFLRTEYSEENILFYLACEELKRCHFRVASKVKKIFRTFIEVDSPYELNLDFEEKAQIERDMKIPSRTVFDVAQKKIRCLMANDSYPRFLKSSLYNHLLQRSLTNRAVPQAQRN